MLITKNCNTLLHQRIIQLERNAVINAQYTGGKLWKLTRGSVTLGIKETVCRAISLTGYEVTPGNLHACHRLKNKDRAILKFKDRKLKALIQINKKVLQQKSLKLSQLNVFGKLFISESMCYENQQLA